MSLFLEARATATAISCCSGRYSKFFAFESRPFSEKIDASFDKVAAERIFECDHGIAIAELRFVYEEIELVCGTGNIDRKSNFEIHRETARSLRPAEFSCRPTSTASPALSRSGSSSMSATTSRPSSMSACRFIALLHYYLTQLPQILVILLPVSLLLALLFCLGRMSRANEIVSMLTAGVSMPRLLFPLLSIGLLTVARSRGSELLARPARRLGAQRSFIEETHSRRQKGR